MDGSCSSCGDMTISELRNRLRCVKHGGVPLPLPRSGVRPGTKRGGTASGGVRGDLRITVRASPSGGSHPSGTPQLAGVPLVRTGASAEWGTPPVSFGAFPDDQMSVAALEGEPSLSGDDEPACCFHSGCSPSACSSPWAPPCGRPRSHAAAAAFHRAASWSRSQTGRPARPGPRQTRRQAQVQEALRRATQRWRELLVGRW